MSNMLNLIKGLQHIIKSADWTNSPERQQMAKEYYDFCQSYAENIEKCRELMERDMLVEATEWANRQEPSLSRQLELLNFEGIKDYRILCSIYEWPNPPELDSSVLEQMKNQSLDTKNLQPLLSAYRQVVRTDNIKMKVLLLRRLVKMDQKSNEWKNALNQQESIMMEQLIRQAKKMIQGKEFDALQQLFQEITDPEWTITAPVQVVGKIESVLEEHRLEKLKEEAVKCLDKINEAYSSFEFESLGKALAEWKNLISCKAYQPEDFEANQVKEAEDYWLQQQKQQQDEKQFNFLQERLSQLLLSDGSQEDMDMIYNQLVLMDRQLPENILQQYFSTKENYEIIQRRKRIFKTALMAACTVLLLALIGVGVHLFIRHNTEQKWVEQLEKALKEPTSAVALDLIRHLKKDDPALCQSPAISALIGRAEKMFESEELKRKNFIKLAKEVRDRLKIYEEHRIKLQSDFNELKKLVVDEKEKAVMKELDAELAAQVELFQIRQKKIYDGLIDQIGRKRGQFYTQLEAQNFNAALNLIREITQLESQAAPIYNHVRDLIPGKESEFAQSEELRNVLVREQAKYQNVNHILEQIYMPSSLDDLVIHIKEYVEKMPNSKLVPELKKLQSSVALAKESVKVLNGKVPVSDNIFSKDFEAVSEYRKNSRETARKIKTHFQKLVQLFSRSKIFAVAVKDSDDVIYDFYYTRNDMALNRINNDFTCRLKVISSDSGDTADVILDYDSNKQQRIKITLPEKEAQEFTLIYPQPQDDLLSAMRNYQNIAPHIRLVENISYMLVDADNDNIEPTLVKVFSSLLKNRDEALNCQLQASLIGIVYKYMAELDKENPSYQDFLNSFDIKDIVSKISWYRTYKEPNMQKKLRSSILSASNINVYSRHMPFVGAWEKLVARDLTPAGFISGVEGKWVFHLLPSAPREGELWMISSGPDSKNYIIGKYKNNTVSLLPGAAKLKVDHLLLLTPTAFESTENVTREIQKKYPSAKNSLPLRSWPVPAN